MHHDFDSLGGHLSPCGTLAWVRTFYSNPFWHTVDFFYMNTFFTDLQRYSYIVFYDHDGTSAANVYSHISAIFSNLTAAMTDVSVILGGIDRVKLHFPHLVR